MEKGEKRYVKTFSKSEWILPAPLGANVFFVTVQARDSFGPEVKYVIKFNCFQVVILKRPDCILLYTNLPWKAFVVKSSSSSFLSVLCWKKKIW